MLETQFADAGFDVVGVQEGRSELTHERLGYQYKMLIAQADVNGSYGVQLWIRHSSHIRVEVWRAFNPRLLFAVVSVKIGNSMNRSGYIAGHAPTLHADRAVKDAWWTMVGDLLTKLSAQYLGVDFILLLDANARVGSIVTEGIGSAGAQSENDNGQRLRCLCTDHSYALVNTFGPGSGFAWTSTRNTRHRIDYIAVPTRMISDATSCRVHDEIDLTMMDREDHFAVSAGIITRAQPDQKFEKKDVFRVNKTNLTCEWRRHAFQDMVWRMRPSSPYLHIDDHLEEYNTGVKHVATICFG